MNSRIEYECNPTDIIIFVRDLDGLEEDSDKIQYRKSKFSEFNSVVDKKGIFLLTIFELETLLFFDLEMFNKITNGGIPRKTLNCIMGGTNVGKSLALCHMAANYLNQGLNVLYITLPMHSYFLFSNPLLKDLQHTLPYIHLALFA